MTEKARKCALGLTVALVFFLAVEAILRGLGVVPLHERTDPYVGFAGYSPLFVERSRSDGQRVFATAPAKLDWFNYQQFPVRKAPGVTRVFCLGGSTTYGRPYDDRTSFCGWLREFLPAVDPSRKWEVINAGGISYASFRVVRLMEEIELHEPDLFIIYTGHNEFLEKRTYDRMLRTPELVMNLGALASRLRLYSLMAKVAYEEQDVLPTEVDTVLDNSVGPEDYHRDDAMRDAVLAHFRSNLNRMNRIAQRADAELLFVTPASNIGDFSPFKAEPSADLDAAGIRRVRQLQDSVTESLDEDEPARAAKLVARALEIDPRNAELLYLQGRALRAVGRMDAAREAFIAARDEDVAPLRALTSVREAVVEVAREHGVGLVDFARMVEERSPDHIPGGEFFLDHVHPSIEANRMLALAIIDEMTSRGAIDPAPTWDQATISEIAERVESKVDDSLNAQALTNLSRVLTWAGKQEEALRLVDRALSMTSDAHTVFQKATVLVRDGRYEEALPYSRKAVRLMPETATVRRAHGILLAGLGRNQEARRELETAARLDPTMPGLYYHLALVLSHLGHTDQAESTYWKALELEPDHAKACNNLGIILAKRGDIEAAAGLFERAVEADPTDTDARANLEQARSLLPR